MVAKLTFHGAIVIYNIQRRWDVDAEKLGLVLSSHFAQNTVAGGGGIGMRIRLGMTRHCHVLS